MIDNLELPTSIKLAYELCLHKNRNSSSVLDLMGILTQYTKLISTKLPLNQGIRVDIGNDTIFIFVKNKVIDCSIIDTSILEKRENLILDELCLYTNNSLLSKALASNMSFNCINISIKGEEPVLQASLPYVTYRLHTTKQAISYA